MRRERDVIAAFSEITTEAITATKLEGLLRLIGKQLCHLLGVTRCSVYMRRDDDRFHGAAGYYESGNISPAVQAQEAGIDGDYFSREVISSQAPVLINDVLNDPRPHRRTMERWHVRAMLGVPLVFDEDVIGIIFVDNVEQDHTYTDDDVALAELFGRLAALFIRQAMQGAELKDKAAEVARQKNTLEYLADVHQKLTHAVLQGADIGAVVSLLSELSAKPVVLYDEDFEVLSWSAPAALRMSQPPVIAAQIREIASVRGTLDALSVTRPSAVIPPNLTVGLGRRHLMCRLIIEGAPSGFVDIVEVGRSLGDLDTKLAEHGATVLSLQMLSERRQAEAEGQARDDFLSDLLRSSRDETQLIRRGPQFGVDLSEPHVLVRISLAGGEQQLSASASRSLVVNRFARTLGIGEPPAVSLPDAVIVLIRLTGTVAEPEGLRTHVESVVSSLTPHLRVRGGVISGVCRRPEDFPSAHRELRELDALARSFGWSRGVLTVDELGLFRVVMNSGRVKEALRFAHELVRPLREHGGQLLETWRAFVAAEGRVQRASHALGVHENTVRYRLARIKEITGQDPAGLDQLLAARMAFQVLDLAGW
ncbi:MAG: GAF domain-containing protein [Pseudonocardiaceae bacterium]|nr:GAF domain-containing protein [Pseudonocardiaceae bacterium]